MTDYISAYRSQMAFMWLDLESDEPRVNAELRVVMAELYLKSNWTKLKTIPRDIFIPTNKLKIIPANRGTWLTGL